MSAFENWNAQKQKLHEALEGSQDVGGVAYALRHTLAQVEQNTMAEQPDDMLRQQAGILFSCVKTGTSLLDVSIATKVWVPASAKKSKKGGKASWLYAMAALLQLAGGLYCYGKGQWIAFALLAAALGVSLAALFAQRKEGRGMAQEEPSRVTLRPDEQRLMEAMDAQMQGIDRYLNDFAYLNGQQAVMQSRMLDGQTLSLLGELLEAVYDYEGDAQEHAIHAAAKLLAAQDMEMVNYSESASQLFTTLPSKTTTRTMVPAILSQKDHRLLRGGVAAARMEPEGQPDITNVAGIAAVPGTEQS